MILYVMVFLIILFLGIYISLLISIFRNSPPKSQIINKLLVSIIVSAKNEEKNIIHLLMALTSQIYPRELVEIILINDGSSDQTLKMAMDYAQTHNNIRILNSGDKIFPGKKGALDIGIREAKHPYILITDADCIPEPEWIHAFVDKFSEGFDLLFGIAPYRQKKNLVNKIASFENLRSSILTFGLAGIGLPYSAAARSFGFTKEVFYKVGGYGNTTKTLSGDDDLLIREAVRHKLKIGTVIAEHSKVYSETKTTFKEYLLQKARHTSTANYYLIKHQITLSIWHFLNLFFLFSPIMTFYSGYLLLPFFIKVTADLLANEITEKKFGYNFSLAEKFFLQINYELMIIINYVFSFFRKDKW